MAANFIGVAVLGYLVGSIPSGLILGRLLGSRDVREHGSRKIGATQMRITRFQGC